MKCLDCEYYQIRQWGQDDFDVECEPPDGVCPYQEEGGDNSVNRTDSRNHL